MPVPSPERWRLLAPHLDRALDLAEPERDALLAGIAVEDPELAAELRHLLALHSRADRERFLDTGGPLAELQRADSVASVGQAVGAYALDECLGEGGMGTVWLAHRSDGSYTGKVAIKLVRPGFGSQHVAARFESERQTLARLDHPNIARILDAGATAGRPYFVMEYVEGRALLEQCDERRLGVRERLELFLDVCAGVQHAHRNGIIHRDLKPGNILVTERDGRPVPKIIDFGIAKAIGARPAEAAPLTRQGDWIGTPAYMSPEQWGSTGGVVDTRSDVFALGVILYELLVGVRPAPDDHEPRHAAPADGGALPPRRRFAALGAGRGDIAARRGTDPEALSRRLEGDLTWIVMKAIEREPDRRYETVAALAKDLRAHLQHQPVEAGPPALSYRARKFLRRHTTAAALTATILLLLGASAIGASIQARRIAREALTARTALRFLTETFHLSDPEQVRGQTITAREILDRAAASLTRELSQTPEVEAEMALTIGRTYGNLGLFTQAEPLVRRAADLRRQELGPGHPATHEALLELAAVLLRRGAVDEADATLGRVRTRAPRAAARARLLAGRVLYERGNLDGAEGAMRAAVDELGRAYGQRAPETLQGKGELAFLLSSRGEYDQADALLGLVVDEQRATLGADHPDVAASLNARAMNQRRAGKYAAAEASYREALGLIERVQGRAHPDTLATLANLGVLLVTLNRFDEAEPILDEALAGQRQAFGPGAPTTLGTLVEWSLLQSARRNHDAAERGLREALAGFQAAYGDEHPETLRGMNNLASALRGRGRLAEAEPYLRTCLAGVRRVFGAAHPNSLVTLANLGELVDQLGRHAEALPMLVEAVDGLHGAFPAGHALIDLTRVKHGRCLAALGRLDEAEAVLLGADRGLEERLGPDHSYTRSAKQGLAELRDARDRAARPR